MPHSPVGSAPDAQTRLVQLAAAQARALELFDEIEGAGLIRVGATELEIADSIRALAARSFDVSRYWHKRLVRGGANTLAPYDESPPLHTLLADDIAFIDLGPIFTDWEADIGRTYVLGDDPAKLRIAADVEASWHACKDYFDIHPDCTGEEFFEFAVADAGARGWEFGGEIAAHQLGEFPHVNITGREVESYAMPGSATVMRSLDPLGRARHWICELHFVDRERAIGGFFEQLMTLD